MMKPLTEGNNEQGSIPVVSLGGKLREAREHLGMSMADVSGQIKLTVRQIEALEADDYRRLPEMPFLRGFVRSYAKALHLDDQPLLALLPSPEPVKMMPEPVEVLFPGVYTLQRQNLIWLGAALLLAVLVVVFAVWHFTTPPATVAQSEIPMPSSSGMPTSAPPGMEAVPAPMPPAASAVRAAVQTTPSGQVVSPSIPAARNMPVENTGTPPVVQAATLRLVFDAASWVEIRDRHDRVLSSQLNQRGSELQLNGDAPFYLAIGHAASVRLYFRGNLVNLTPYIKPSSEVARLTLK